MTKSILSVSGAFISFLCVIILLTAFALTDEPLMAILAVIAAGLMLVFIGYGLDDTKAADKLSELFREEASHE